MEQIEIVRGARDFQNCIYFQDDLMKEFLTDDLTFA